MYKNRNSSTEKSILEAAERLFLEKGFALTSISMIAKEVGCDQSLVHYYFRSKEKLFQLVFDKYLQIFIFGLPILADKKLTLEEQIKHCVYTQFEMLQDHPEIVFFLLNELSTNRKNRIAIKEKLASYTDDFVGFIASELKAEINNGNIRPITPIDLIMRIFTLNAGAFLLYYISKKVTLFTDEEFQVKLEQSKHSNYTLIMKGIKNNLLT